MEWQGPGYAQSVAGESDPTLRSFDESELSLREIELELELQQVRRRRQQLLEKRRAVNAESAVVAAPGGSICPPSVTSIINDVVDEFVSTSQSVLPQLNSTSPSITSRSSSLDFQFTHVSTGPFIPAFVDDMFDPYSHAMTALSPTHTRSTDAICNGNNGYAGLSNEPQLQLQLQTYDERRQGPKEISSDSQLGLVVPANNPNPPPNWNLESPGVPNQTTLNLGGWRRKRRRHDEPEIPGFMCFQVQSGGRSFTRNGKRTRTVNERQTSERCEGSALVCDAKFIRYSALVRILAEHVSERDEMLSRTLAFGPFA